MNTKNIISSTTKSPFISFFSYTSHNELIYYHHSLTPSVPEKIETIKPEVHERIELLYLKTGILTYYIEGIPHRVKPGELLIVNSRQLHSLEINLSEAYDRYVLQFSSDLISDNTLTETLCKNLSHYDNLNCRVIEKELVQRHQIDKLLISIEDKKEQLDKYFYALVTSILLQILIEINRIFDKTTNNQTKPTYHSTINKIITYINENITKKMTINEMAHDLYLSPFYLSHLFYEHMNLSLKQYIKIKRMQYAQTLINQGYTPTETAEKLGFLNYSTFYQSFQSVNKINPSKAKKH